MEQNNQQIFIHKLEIRSLKDQVVKLLEEKHYYGNQMEDQDNVGPGMQQMGGVHMSESMGNANQTRSSANLEKMGHMAQSNQQLEG